jgi:glycosyltransferase involved in cell wall biosynthesis
MRIAVVAALEAASQIANAINTVKMAEGFARLGHEVTLVCTRPLSGPVSETTLTTTYGLTTPFQWRQLPSRRLTGAQWLFGWLARPVIREIQPQFVYTRTYVAPWFTSRQGIPTAGETHAHIGNNKLAFRLFLRASRFEAFRLLVTISERLAAHYQQRGVPMAKTAVLPDAVDLTLFQRPLQLPYTPFSTGSPNVVYSGHLYDYKGIPTILQAASLLPAFNFHLVGGLPADIERHKMAVHSLGLTNVHFHGLQPLTAVPPYLWRADILLLPPSGNHPSAAWTSPVKLGEYLVSGTPIIASDIPALRDWVTDDEVAFVSPDDPQAMAQTIQTIWQDKKRSQQLAQNSLQRGLKMSYTERAHQILRRSGIGNE